MAEPVSDELNGSMFLLRDSKPGDLVLRRRLINGDTFVEVALRPVPGSVMVFDQQLRPSVESLGDLASYQSLVNVANDATRLLLTTEFVRDGSRVYVLDTGRYWDVVDATELPGAAAFVEILTSAALATANDAAVTATVQAALAAQWAAQTSGIVAATDYSAKEFAAGSQAGTGGSAKNWAQQTGADVTGASANSRSAKSWAQGNNTGATLGGSAKDWAQSASLPDGTNKSAKSYSADAAGSAVAAAGSATTALNAIAQSFKGGISGASVPSTSPLAGDYYRITTAGTSQSKTWVIGDAAIYNGSSGSWTQLTGWFAYADGVGMVVASFAGGYINSDGVTTNRAPGGIYGPFDAVNNPREYVAGAASLTEAIVLTVPTANPSSSAYLFRHTATTTPGVAPVFATYTLQADIRTDGSLYITQTASSGSFEYRDFYYAGFRAAYSGQTGFLKIYFVQGTTNPVVTWNGINISASFTLVTNGTTPPAWLDANLVPTYRLVGYNWPSGPAPIVTPILGQTSASDDAFYLQTGKWPAWVVAGGSAASLYSGDTQTFTSGVGSWSNQVSGLISASGGKGVVTGISGYYDGIKINSALVAGRKYRLVCTLSSLVGGTTVTIADGSGATYSPNLVSGLNTVDFTAGTGGSTQNLLIIGGGSGCTGFSIDDFFLYPLGALSVPSVQPINVLDDVSTIGGNQGRILGGTPVTNATAFRVSANTWTNGNQQILAGSILDSTKHIIDQVEQFTTGTPTTTIGSASAGAQYKASSALTAGINPTTLVTRKLASNDVWVNSNSTAVVRTTITSHIAT